MCQLLGVNVCLLKIYVSEWFLNALDRVWNSQGIVDRLVKSEKSYTNKRSETCKRGWRLLPSICLTNLLAFSPIFWISLNRSNAWCCKKVKFSGIEFIKKNTFFFLFVCEVNMDKSWMRIRVFLGVAHKHPKNLILKSPKKSVVGCVLTLQCKALLT